MSEITALGVFIGTILTAIAALLNSINARKETKETAAQYSEQQKELKRFRGDVIRMGESMVLLRADNAKLAALVGEVIRLYEKDMGKKPDIDLKAVAYMMDIYYITSPLGHIDEQAVRKLQ